MKTLITALTLATLAAPAFLQSASAAPPVGDARERAVQECSVLAQKYSQSMWGHFQLDQYRTCMADHGQPE
jgi:hypothetical protein